MAKFKKCSVDNYESSVTVPVYVHWNDLIFLVTINKLNIKRILRKPLFFTLELRH